MKIPTNLKHKPVIVAKDYSRIDGKYAYATDVQGLSAGLAQWNDRGKVDISAKNLAVYRTEMVPPVGRAPSPPCAGPCDLRMRYPEILPDAYRYPKLYNPENRSSTAWVSRAMR